jgi:hypothetical protein
LIVGILAFQLALLSSVAPAISGETAHVLAEAGAKVVLSDWLDYSNGKIVSVKGWVKATVPFLVAGLPF